MSKLFDSGMHRSAIKPSKSQSSLPVKLLGGWQLEQQIVHGRLTSVYYARPLGCPPSWHADYVVKALNPRHTSDPLAKHVIQRESEVGRHSSHPNLVPILEAQLDAELPHLVMPRIDGVVLSRVLERVGRLVIPQALWVTRQVAQAARHLHSQGWIHGDIKPANIVVSGHGHATLIDLGSALRPDESIYMWQRPLVGTLAYVAPEVLTSRNHTSPSSDIYSMGLTLFELLTGSLPFNHVDPAKQVEAHLSQPVPPIREIRPEIPESVADLVRRMLAKTPVRRPPSADSLIDELAGLEIETLESRFQSADAA